MAEPLRIAMWSGPRNISTALMRAWENRRDTAVVDEPFYAYYLQATGLDHPVRDEVIAAGQTDWRRVVQDLLGPVPGGLPVFYQKQMTHHLLPEIERGWMGRVANCFLIRDPREVLLSYGKRRSTVTVEDVGVLQQAEIHDYVRDLTAEQPPVLDARDVLQDPRRALTLLCRRLGLPFSARMLAWPTGPRDSDGVWAPHWYGDVLASTGFRPWRERRAELPPRLEPLVEACRPHYERLYEQRLR